MGRDSEREERRKGEGQLLRTKKCSCSSGRGCIGEEWRRKGSLDLYKEGYAADKPGSIRRPVKRVSCERGADDAGSDGIRTIRADSRIGQSVIWRGRCGGLFGGPPRRPPSQALSAAAPSQPRERPCHVHENLVRSSDPGFSLPKLSEQAEAAVQSSRRDCSVAGSCHAAQQRDTRGARADGGVTV